MPPDQQKESFQATPDPVRKAQLGQPRRPPDLPGDRLHPTAPLPGGQLPGGPTTPRDPCLFHQPPHRDSVRAQLGSDLGQPPLLLDEPIGQVRPHLREAKLGDPPGDPLVSLAASLAGQPLPAGWQFDAEGVSAWLMVQSLTPSSWASRGTLAPLSHWVWR